MAREKEEVVRFILITNVVFVLRIISLKKTERQEAMKNIISQQINIKENKMYEKTIEDWDSIIARLNELEQNDLAEELARFLGVSRPTITRWMKKQTIPHPAMMESLIKKIKEEHIKEDK